MASPQEGGDSDSNVCGIDTVRYLCPASAPNLCPYGDGGGLCFPTPLEAFGWCGACQRCDGTDGSWTDGGGCYGALPPLPPTPIDGGTPWPEIPYQGGPVLHDPQVVILTYGDFAADAGPGQPSVRDQIEQYYRWLTHSAWIPAVGAEYGVEHSDVLAVDHLGAAPASLTDGAIRLIIEQEIALGHIPAPGPETVYFLHTPLDTTVTWLDQQLCVAFTGYHSWDGQRVYPQDAGVCELPIIYSVVATCPPPTGSGVTQLQAIELSVSHHLMENATDPLGTSFWDAQVQTNFGFVDGEVSDLCDPISIFYPATYATDAGTQIATRVWSDAAAATGDPNPCVPLIAPANEQVAQTIPAQVLSVSPGESTSFTTTGVGSTAAPSTWTIHVFQILGPEAVVPTAGVMDTSGPGVTTTVPVTIPTTAHSGDYFALEIHVLEGGAIVDQPVEEVVLEVP